LASRWFFCLWFPEALVIGRVLRSIGFGQSEPDTPDGLKKVRGRVQLVPQALDVGVHGPARHLGMIAPDLGQQLPPRAHASR
jgi:hypothetical protein